MITLYQTPVAWGMPNLSPFCFKLESYLRMAGLPYTAKLAQLPHAPKGKVPYVDHPVEYPPLGNSKHPRSCAA